MKHLHYSCQGESHVLTNKVCQDASFSEITENASVAIVCDGHGGARYFRSDVGAKIAVEATRSCVSAFVKEIDLKLFANKPFTQKQDITSEINAEIPTKETQTDIAFRQLFSSIIYSWHTKVEQHANETPLTDEERQNVEPHYIEDFENRIELEKTYGCTLMCYVRTPDYWFAFHIGDGKCIAFDEEGRWYEPVPWDNRCFLNKTTSLCDSSALDEFRYCYEGDGKFPFAIVLGSDGMDDSFGETENMVNFYVQVLKLLANECQDNALQTIKDTLPQLSKMGSKDDMSVAIIYDDKILSDKVMRLISWQKNNVGDMIAKNNERILKLRDTISKLESKGLSSRKVMIDYQYAKTDLIRAFETKRKLAERWNRFSKELNGDDFSPWADEIGFGNIDVFESMDEGHNEKESNETT